MKKILSMIFVLAVIIFPATCQAGSTRVADVGAENLYRSIANFVNSGESKIYLSNFARNSSFDQPSLGVVAWSCDYGLKSSSTRSGKLNFYVNGGGYVSFVEILAYPSQNDYFDTIALTFLTCQVLGLNKSEAEDLYQQFVNNYDMSGNVWCYAKNRRYSLSVLPAENNNIKFLVLAFDS